MTLPVRGSRGISAYLLIAFGMAWMLWAVALSTTEVSPRSPLFQLLILPGAFSPAIAAVVVRRWVTREGFSDGGLGLNLRRWRYYLFALVWPFIAVTVIVALAAAFGVSSPDFSLLRALGEVAPGEEDVPAFPTALWPVVLVQLMIVAVVATPVLWGEEFGWRGYLQLRLLGDRPLLAAVFTGLIWGVWHYPLILAGYQYPDDRVLELLLLPVGTVLLSIFFGWLRLKTGSI